MYHKGVCPMERQIPTPDTLVMTGREEGVSLDPVMTVVLYIVDYIMWYCIGIVI